MAVLYMTTNNNMTFGIEIHDKCVCGESEYTMISLVCVRILLGEERAS